MFLESTPGLEGRKLLRGSVLMTLGCYDKLPHTCVRMAWWFTALQARKLKLKAPTDLVSREDHLPDFLTNIFIRSSCDQEEGMGVERKELQLTLINICHRGFNVDH
jgi:hypothetical protein